MDASYGSYRDAYDDDDITEVSPPLIGDNERRMHVRAYEYWVSLLRGRSCPSIQDLDPASIADFGPNSVLLDFTRSADNPQITYLGRALREECGMLYGIRTVSDVPPRSLLSRLTDQYPEILASKRPTGFEAEFLSHAGLPTLYRGILMPFSSGGDAIDFVYGVIGWKHDRKRPIAVETEAEAQPEPAPEPTEAETDYPAIEPETQDEGEALLPTEASLADWLTAARIGAERAAAGERHAHAALYAAIGLAYDFALAAAARPDDYAALLEKEGLTVQARAPMTPIVKLVFGVDYDKKRVTEYAAALTYAGQNGLGRGELAGYLQAFDGGLKALVKAERARRTPAPKPNRLEQLRSKLREAEPKALVDLDAGEEEFVLLLARRVEQGRLAVLAPLNDPALVDKALRQSTR